MISYCTSICAVLKVNKYSSDTPNNRNKEHSNKNSASQAFQRGTDTFSSNFWTNQIKYLGEFKARMQIEIDKLQYQNTELQDQLKVFQGNSLIKQFNDIATQVDFSLIENSNHQNYNTPSCNTTGNIAEIWDFFPSMFQGA